MPALMAVIAIVAVVGAVLRDDRAGSEHTSTTASPAVRRSEPAGSLLLAHRGADGRADLLVVVADPGTRASVLLVPTATQAEVPSLDVQVLADVPNLGDRSLLVTTVENLLGVRITSSAVLDDAGLASALSLAVPVPVDLGGAVRFAAATDPAFQPGWQQLGAADAVRLLVSAQPGSELDRLVTVQAVLEGWMERLRATAVADETVRTRPELEVLRAAARERERRFETLPVRPVTASGNERFDVNRDELVALARRDFGSLAVGARPRVEILNGTGGVGVAQGIAAKVVPAGGEVTLTSNVPGFGQKATQVVYYRDAERPRAEHLLKALGCGSLRRADRAIGVVDVTILVGTDCVPPGAPGP